MIAVLAGAGSSAYAAREQGGVAHVFDADTFRLENGTRIRIAAIDSAETHFPKAKCVREITIGKAQTERVRALLNGRRVSYQVGGRNRNRLVVKIVRAPRSRHIADRYGWEVARLGQERGFRAIHEEPVSGGRVDVALRRGELAIACEISVSTEVAHELGNVRKCLAAGFHYVVLIATDEGKRGRLQNASAKLGRREISICSPEELAQFLDALQVPEAGEKLVRGYKIRVNRQKQSLDEAAKRRDAIGKVVVRSIKREE